MKKERKYKKVQYDNFDPYNENQKEKSNNKVKWIVILIVLVTIIGISIGITMFVKSPQYAVMQTLNNLKEGNLSQVNKYVNYKSVIIMLDDKIEVKDNMSDLEKNCFNKITYRINSEKIIKNNASVEVEITNKNYRNALGLWAKEIFQKQVKGEEITDAQSTQILEKYLNDESIGTITVTKTLNLQKVENNWNIIVDENLQEAIFPGLNEIVESINSLLEK